MKIALRIALLLVVCISILFFLSYKEGITNCGSCYDHMVLFQDFCYLNMDDKKYYCDYTEYTDKRACCNEGPSQYIDTCNTSSGQVAFERYYLNEELCSGLHIDICSTLPTCNQNPQWTYSSYDNCTMGDIYYSGTIPVNLCN